MKHCTALIAAACVLAGLAAGGAAGEKPLRIVVVTGGHKFQAKPFLAVFKDMKGISFVHAPQKNHSELFEDVEDFPYDVIVLYNATQKISAKRRANFLKLMDRPVGLVALHHCITAFETWPMFPKIIGGRYYRKQNPALPKGQKLSVFKHDLNMNIRVAVADHPVTQGLSDFVIHDETYKHQAFEPDNTVLLTCDHPTSDRPIAWVRSCRKARVCYIQLGHGPEAYANASYRRLVANAIRWAAAGAASPAAGGPNVPPPGFVALFNGRDLAGWKGLVGNPKTRAKMTGAKLAAAQAAADQKMRRHWKVAGGVLAFDGKGASLCTAKDYADFEMLVDWKITKGGDSGIYLRGSPQVQIWDTAGRPEGSGGLFNNKKNPSKPLKCADRPIGQWNTFRIRMIGARVTVHLNGVLVADGVVMENFWERNRPIYAAGQIELQSHNSKLWFRNIFIRRISRDGAKEKTQ